MGGWKKGAALAVLVGMLAAHAAFAQTVGDGAKTATTGTKIGGVNFTDSTGVVYGEGSVPHSLPVEDVARDRDSWTLVQNIIANNAITLAARADSTTVPIDIHKFRRVGLAFYGLVDSLTTRATIAVECRCHGSASADTASSYVIEPWSARATTTLAWADSFGVTGATPLGDIATAAPGEASWVLQPKPSQPHIRYKSIFGPNDLAPPCPYLSVRLRLLTLAGAGASRVRVRVHLLGSSL